MTFNDYRKITVVLFNTNSPILLQFKYPDFSAFHDSTFRDQDIKLFGG